MNISTLGAFRLFYSPYRNVHVIALYAAGHEVEAKVFERMISGWNWVRSVSQLPMGAQVVLPDAIRKNYVAVTIGAAPAQLPHPGVDVIKSAPPTPEEESFGFYQELESHDYELGGLNEWREDMPISLLTKSITAQIPTIY